MTLLLLALACRPDAPELTLVYSARIDGEIEPCG